MFAPGNRSDKGAFSMVRQKSLTLGETASLFYADRVSQRMAKATVAFYKEKVGHFIHFCAGMGVTMLDQVKPVTVRQYFAWMIDAGWAPYSQNINGRAVRAFLRWCVKEKLCKHNPMENVKIPTPPKEVHPAIKPGDVQALVEAAADARARAIILMLLDTGMRAREFRDLLGGDVDIDAGTVRVRRGKTGKGRTAFLSSPTVKALLAYYRERGWPDENERLWRALRTNQPLTDSGIRQVIDDTCAAAGIKHVSMHDFRRTFALWHLRQGVDLHTLAKLMGHADITVLKMYLDLDDTDTLEAHRRANIVSNYLK